MGSLVIRKLKYYGDLYEYESPVLNDGLNIIEGDNGTGKTTFMNLIYYCLGGYVPEFREKSTGWHKEIIEDSNNYVELVMEINKASFVIRRYLNSNNITVASSPSKAEVFSLKRDEQHPFTFSDWVLDKLDIEVIEVYQSNNYHWKINITDLFRLIYYDQNPDPSDIYKAPERDNFLSDSKFFRKVIFQVLMGKSFTQYYSKYAQMKESEREVEIAKLALDKYSEVVKAINKNENLNLVYLNKNKELQEEELTRLVNYRSQLKVNRSPASEIDSKLESLKNQLTFGEIKESELKEKKSSVLDEKGKLLRLKSDTILEVTQLTKIIFTQDKLALFSPDTCPYCLKNVQRTVGNCICGNSVEEDQYEKFFYNRSEYSDILRSKQKSVETIELAITENDQIVKEIEDDISKLQNHKNQVKDAIELIIKDMDSGVDLHALNEIDDKILEVRETITSIKQNIELEIKRDELQGSFDSLLIKYESSKNKVAQLDSLAKEELSERVTQFNDKYNDLMREALTDCKNAKINSDDYAPIINNSEYREASARVPIRLMYYLTLLYLSIHYKDTNFPNFLLIDNPNTSGIDLAPLKESMNQLTKVIDESNKNSFQIILATGRGVYPDEYKQYVFGTLTKENKLLKSKKEK